MERIPCRASTELRQYLAAQEKAGRLYDGAERGYEALEAIHDGEALKKILEDEFLAPFIAEALAGLENASLEIAALPVEACPITKLVLNRLARMERVLYAFALENK